VCRVYESINNVGCHSGREFSYLGCKSVSIPVSVQFEFCVIALRVFPPRQIVHFTWHFVPLLFSLRFEASSLHVGFVVNSGFLLPERSDHCHVSFSRQQLLLAAVILCSSLKSSRSFTPLTNCGFEYLLGHGTSSAIFVIFLCRRNLCHCFLRTRDLTGCLRDLECFL
jgi:hypothetical protein